MSELASRREWAADIAGFRGFAALTVVVFHAWQFARDGGQAAFTGTPAGTALAAFDGIISWFFVTSAYLLFLPVAQRVLAGREPGSARGFLVRRALRVLPLYVLAVLVVWSWRNPVLPGDWVDLVEHLTLTHVFDSERVFYTIGPAWALSAEFAFYLVMTGLIVLFTRLRLTSRDPRARLAAVVVPAVALIAVSGLWSVGALASGVPLERWAVWFNPVPWLGDFGLGMLLAVLVARRRGRPLPAPALGALRVAALAGLVLGAALVHGDDPIRFVAFHDSAAVCYALLLATSVLAPPTSRWRRALARPALIWVGTISFSLYLWHEPVLLWLDSVGLVSRDPAAFPALAVLLCVLGVAAGAASYHLLEQPLRRLRYLFTRDGRLRRPRPAGVVTGAEVPLPRASAPDRPAPDRPAPDRPAPDRSGAPR